MQVEEIEELRQALQHLEKILEALKSIDQSLRQRQQQQRQGSAPVAPPSHQVQQAPEPRQLVQESERTPQEVLKSASEQAGRIRQRVAQYSAHPGLTDRVIGAVREHLSNALEHVDRFEAKLRSRRQQKAEAQQRKRVEKTLSKMPEIKSVAELYAVLDHLQKKLDSFKGQLGQERAQDQPEAIQQDYSPAQSRTPVQKADKQVDVERAQAVDGVILIDHGPAPFQFDLTKDPSYFVRVRNPQGAETVLWGKGLEAAIQRAGAKPGNVITATKTGRVPVEVDAAKRDPSGNRIAVERIETHRNEWEIAVVQSKLQQRRSPKTQEPPGWREWVKERYPCTVLPDSYTQFQEVFADLAKEFRENTKNTLEGAALKLREEVTQGSITPSEAAQKLIEQAPAGMAASAKIAAREAVRAAFENGGSLLKVVSQLKATPEQTQAVSKAVAMSK